MICSCCGRPKLLDLYSCAGGAAKGYSRAGFCVTGVDLLPQRKYPYAFVQGDAVEFLKERGHEFAAVHASPPCQHFSTLRSMTTHETSDLVGVTRDALVASGLPWIIENVVGAPLVDPIMLCGTEFDLGAMCRDGVYRQLRRHRLFESNVPLARRGVCRHDGQPLGVYGVGGGGQQTRGYKGYADECREAMGIDWMAQKELSQAIPPAFSRWLGVQLLEAALSD